MEDLLKNSPYNDSPREAEEQSVMRYMVRPGDVVYDIGANIGLHSVLLSALVGPSGKLYAFEPNLELLPNLKRTLQPLSNTELYSFALSNRAAKSTLYVPEDKSMARLRDWDGQVGAHSVICEEQRMDDLIASGALLPPDFIKCDVEGAEFMVFTGAQKTLNQINAPIILFEINTGGAQSFGNQGSDAQKFLANLELPSYRFFEVKDGCLQRVDILNVWFTNVVGIPEAKLDRLPQYSSDSQMNR